MSGWFRLHRGWRDCEVFAQGEPLSEREAWLWLIEKAAWKPCIRTNAKGERIKVERGQFHTSLRALESAWGWGKNKVARYLQRLVDHEMVGTVAGQSGMVITVLNYDKYQDERDGRDTETGTVAGQSRDTQEEGKEGKEKKSAARGTRLTADFVIPDDWLELAIAERHWSKADVDAEGRRFVDYWCAKPGKDGTKTDWLATWRNWFRGSNRPDGANTGKVVQIDPSRRAETIEGTAQIYDRQGRETEAAQLRREAARLRKSASIGSLIPDVKRASH